MTDSKEQKKGSKLKRYIATRIWNARVSGNISRLSTRKILSEIEERYLGGKSLEDNPILMRNLTLFINSTRTSTHNKWEYYKRMSVEWASILSTDPYRMLNLIRKGFIKTQTDVKDLKKVLQILGYLDK